MLSLNLIKNKGSRSYLRFKQRDHGSDPASYVYLQAGQPLILIGGVQTGKTRKLNTLKALMEKYQEPVIYLDGLLPLGDWVAGCEGKNILTRTGSLLNSATKDTYLIIDNAEKINDSRKLDTALKLLWKGRNMVVACDKLGNLNWKLRRRLELKGARIEYLGGGGRRDLRRHHGPGGHPGGVYRADRRYQLAARRGGHALSVSGNSNRREEDMNLVWSRKNHFFWKRDKPLDLMPMKELVSWTRFLCDLWLLEAESSGNAYLELGTLHQELAYTLKELLEVMQPDPKQGWSNHFRS